MPPINLQHDPYSIFRSNRSPCGLYARQKWLQEASTDCWREDFNVTVKELYSGQGENGLWSGSPIDTIHRLFGLHLTIRNADTHIDKALLRLVDSVRNPLTEKGNDHLQPDSLRGVPFTPSRWIDFVLPATLFLCAIFGKASDPTVLRLYNRMACNVVGAEMDSPNSAFLNNCFRALVVNPDFSLHEAVQAVVSWLARQQTFKGDWGEDIPFFQTVNALSHLNTPESDAQCQKAINLVASTQNADGSWGKTEKEWSTFLSIHALKSKGLL